MKRIISLAMGLIALIVSGQILEPIKWSSQIKMDDETSGEIIVTAHADNGWHIYGMEFPAKGPIPTKIDFKMPPEVIAESVLIPSREADVEYSADFEGEISWWDGTVTFTKAFSLKGTPSNPIDVKVSYQACDNRSCLPPATEHFSLLIPGTEPVTPVATPSAIEEEESSSSIVALVKKNNSVTTGEESIDIWAPVEEDVNGEPVSESPWWKLFIWGFGSGFIALMTPCVWPLIPMTVSFFLKKGKKRRDGIKDAMIYGVSIIVIFLVLGLAITMLFGASKLNELSTNAVFNIIFFLLLVVFAISFFGAFDIKLPSKWSNMTDNRAERTTGLLSIFFMAFTLFLVSFSCTGPILGTLLVEAATTGDITGPAVGMGGFALALALPFTLFAIFPTWLKEMPRSGGWLNSVKVVLGFLELALSLKFLSVADLAYGWGLLDREIFLALWIVIFLLLGLYLLGKIRFAHDEPIEHVSVPRFFLSIASLSFMVYLIPGLWGAPLKGVSAFVPPLYTQDFNLYEGGVFEEFDDYDAGMKYATENNRPVLIDFSGYGCVNCRKMEGAVFDTEAVSQKIKENFVLIKLMVDDKHELTEPMTVNEKGKSITLNTVGEKWSYLQRHKFSANTQPYYIMVDGRTGRALAPSRSYNENVTEFVEWLDEGIKRYNDVN